MQTFGTKRRVPQILESNQNRPKFRDIAEVDADYVLASHINILLPRRVKSKEEIYWLGEVWSVKPSLLLNIETNGSEARHCPE